MDQKVEMALMSCWERGDVVHLLSVIVLIPSYICFEFLESFK